MAYDAIRAQMDQLMGAERDLPEHEKKNITLKFYDKEVDKFWLCGFSPHNALSNTKSDIGPPPGRQENAVKEQWDALPQEEKDKYGFEFDLKEELDKMVEDMDRRIQRTKERVEITSPIDRLAPEVAEQVREMEKQIRQLQSESEKLGEEGDVDQSLALHTEAAEIEKKRADLVRQSANPNEKQQFVCEVSGLIYSSTDNDARIRDLQSGRQYLGWKKIRDHLVKLRARNPPRGQPGFGREKQDADRREREKDSGRDKDRVRDRDRDRDRRHDDRDRRYDDRDRDRDRDRRYEDRYDDRGRRDYDDRDRRDRDRYGERQESRYDDRGRDRHR